MDRFTSLSTLDQTLGRATVLAEDFVSDYNGFYTVTDWLNPAHNTLEMLTIAISRDGANPKRAIELQGAISAYHAVRTLWLGDESDLGVVPALRDWISLLEIGS